MGLALPFIFSLFLLGIAGWVRAQLVESPLWERLLLENRLSHEPLVEAGRNWKKLALALFGATAGQGVIWYTAQFFSLQFMTKLVGVPLTEARFILATALLCAMPFFVVFGALSDQIGRKRLMVVGNLLAAMSFFPIYRAMQIVSNPLNEVAMTALVFVQVLLVTMTYGPIAAFLVEFFPARPATRRHPVPPRERHLWRAHRLPRLVDRGQREQQIRRAGLPLPRCAAHGGNRGMVSPRDLAHPHLGRGSPRRQRLGKRSVSGAGAHRSTPGAKRRAPRPAGRVAVALKDSVDGRADREPADELGFGVQKRPRRGQVSCPCTRAASRRKSFWWPSSLRASSPVEPREMGIVECPGEQREPLGGFRASMIAATSNESSCRCAAGVRTSAWSAWA